MWSAQTGCRERLTKKQREVMSATLFSSRGGADPCVRLASNHGCAPRSVMVWGGHSPSRNCIPHSPDESEADEGGRGAIPTLTTPPATKQVTARAEGWGSGWGRWQPIMIPTVATLA